MATVEQDIKDFQSSGERSLSEIKRVLSEEKKVEEKTQDRLTELANILRRKYTDRPDEDLTVIKETITIGKGEDQQEFTRYRGMTKDEKLQRRKEQGTLSIMDIFQMGELPTALRNWRDASNWVNDSDDSVIANLVRKFLGDNSQNIERRTERIEGRERIERELQEKERETDRTVENNNREKVENDSRDLERVSNTETRSLSSDIVPILSDIIDANKLDREPIPKGESATDKENKTEELSLFNKQNAILKGIYDNTLKLLESTNKLQILKEQTPQDSSRGIVDDITDLVGLAKGGKVFQKGKSIATKILRKGKDAVGGIASKGESLATKVSPQMKNTFSTIFEGAKTIGQKAATSSIASNTIDTMKANTKSILKMGTKVGATVGTKGIPIIGALVSGAVNTADYLSTASAIDEMVERGEITKEEGDRQKRIKRGEATGSTIGTTAGTAIGGTLGAVAGPIGFAVGSTIGGFIGDSIGGWLGGWFSEEEEPKKEEAKPTTEQTSTEVPKPTEKDSSIEEPNESDDPKKSIHERYVERQEKIRNGEITQVVRIGGKSQAILFDNSRIDKKVYDKKVADEENLIRKLDMSKTMTDEEIKATAKRNVFSKMDTATTYNAEKSRLEEIASINETDLKKYNEEKRREHDRNGYDSLLGEYQDVTAEDIKKAKEELKTFDTKENIQRFYDEKEESRKDLASKTDRNTVYQTVQDGKVLGETVMKNGEIVSSFDNSANASGIVEFKVNENIDRSRYFRRDNEPIRISKPSDIAVPPRSDGAVMYNNAEQINRQEKESSKDMKVEVVNNNVQNINQTKDKPDPMYSRNTDPSYVRTLDERHGIMG